MELNRVSVSKMLIREKLKYNGETLLTYQIEYPNFRSNWYPLCLLKVNKFYQEKALAFQKYCKTELFRMAIIQYHESIKNNYPIRAFDAVLSYEVKYLHSCIISIYFDQYEYTGGAHGNTIRESQTWNLQNCDLIKLRQLIRLPEYRAYIFLHVESQIKMNSDLYFENYRKLIDNAFKEDSFFCIPEGIVVYFQQYDIAPYSSGIREFLLPYTNGVINPKLLCR